MELRVNLFQSRLINVGIDLCRADAGMSQQLLHLSQIGTSTEQVGRKTVPQCVGAH